jgi:hypothetical protein
VQKLTFLRSRTATRAGAGVIASGHGDFSIGEARAMAGSLAACPFHLNYPLSVARPARKEQIVAGIEMLVGAWYVDQFGN